MRAEGAAIGERAAGAARPGAAEDGGATVAPAPGPRQGSAWRSLFRFRARTRPDIELWVGILAFALVLGAGCW